MKDNVKFWTFLAGMILMVSVTVLLIDMSIKAAILEESNALRLVIEESRNGQRKESADHKRTSGNGSGTPDVLGQYDAGMETGNVRQSGNGTSKARTRRQPIAKPSDNTGKIPDGN